MPNSKILFYPWLLSEAKEATPPKVIAESVDEMNITRTDYKVAIEDTEYNNFGYVRLEESDDIIEIPVEWDFSDYGKAGPMEQTAKGEFILDGLDIENPNDVQPVMNLKMNGVAPTGLIVDTDLPIGVGFYSKIHVEKVPKDAIGDFTVRTGSYMLAQVKIGDDGQPYAKAVSSSPSKDNIEISIGLDGLGINEVYNFTSDYRLSDNFSLQILEDVVPVGGTFKSGPLPYGEYDLTYYSEDDLSETTDSKRGIFKALKEGVAKVSLVDNKNKYWEKQFGSVEIMREEDFPKISVNRFFGDINDIGTIEAVIENPKNGDYPVIEMEGDLDSIEILEESNGFVKFKALDYGVIEITVRSNNHPKVTSRSGIKIQDLYNVTSIRYTPPEISMSVGESARIRVSKTPSYQGYEKFEIIGDSDAILVDYDPFGFNPLIIAEALKEGSVILRGSNPKIEGVVTETHIDIKEINSLTAVKIDTGGDMVLEEGDSMEIEVLLQMIDPDRKPNKNLSWSYNNEIISMSYINSLNKSTLTALKEGTTTLTVIDKYTELHDSTEVVVLKKEEEIEFDLDRENPSVSDFIEEGRFFSNKLVIDGDREIDFNNAVIHGESFDSRIENKSGKLEVVPDWKREFINSYITKISARDKATGDSVILIPRNEIYVKGLSRVSVGYGFTKDSIRVYQTIGSSYTKASGFFKESDMNISATYKGEPKEVSSANYLTINTKIQSYKENVFNTPETLEVSFAPSSPHNSEDYEEVHMLAPYDKNGEIKNFSMFGLNLAPITGVEVDSKDYHIVDGVVPTITLRPSPKGSHSMYPLQGSQPQWGMWLECDDPNFTFDEDTGRFSISKSGDYTVKLVSDENDLYLEVPINYLT